MLKVAIVGCGKIADAHASQIRRIAGCEIVGVCDKEPLMARQLYERFPIRRYFSDVADLLREARPDVVHGTSLVDAQSGGHSRRMIGRRSPLPPYAVATSCDKGPR